MTVRSDLTDLYGPVWTIGEALAFLDPPIPRRTLSRILRGLTPATEVTPAHGGPPVRMYAVGDVMRAHAAWAARIRRP